MASVTIVFRRDKKNAEGESSNAQRPPQSESIIRQLPAQEETFTEVETTEEPTSELVTAEIFKDPPKQKRFNLMGDLIEEQDRDRERARKMNQWKRLNSDL